ncbi:MAG: hypothetical protein K8R08_03815 [Methanosarcinales archaeon]|nr:hypothetical protein [Methanosarcinales archaeon]
MKIVDIQINLLSKRLKDKKINIVLTEKARDCSSAVVGTIRSIQVYKDLELLDASDKA